MHTVMLVDDDYPVLEFLTSAIPWSRLNLKLHSSCKNGLLALKAAEEQMPDIVVTDIGMPQMDGLALIARLKAMKPDIRCIILSCMEDFAYAQQAVRLQVDDYVLKETMRPQQIADLLEKLKEQIALAERNSFHLAKLESAAEDNTLLLRQGLLERIVSTPADEEGEPNWIGEAARLGIEFDGRELLPALAVVNRWAALTQSPSPADERSVQLAVADAALELAAAHPGVQLLPHGAREYVLLFPFRRTLKSSASTTVHSLLLQLGESFRQRTARAGGLSLTFFTGAPAARPAALVRSLSLLLASEERRFYLAEGDVHALFPSAASIPVSAAASFEDDSLHTLYPEALAEIREAFLDENEPLLECRIRKWMDHIRERRYPPEAVKEWALKLMYDIQSRFQSLQHYQSLFSIEVLHRTLAAIATVEELTEWTLKFFKERLPHLSLLYGQSRRSEIQRAQQYVAKNIGKKITLEEVADLLHINSSYFSRLFKKETGHNFIHYVTLAKMERAKELLAHKTVSVEEVADRLGYENKSYFTKLFKKHCGTTPGEYRGD
ncbi:helix-turn-helix domain-containing protein [Cohnella fermenti]|uniref:Helix-turn-helix domain-containing protein n=1 Tax=Cohnella fermenti TaxID=2565925 RepID=A0A4V3WGN3_9BACL|nr:helix-turn-helix domain-containing protein [Cohnella fermenti]THF84466.1 helix-turn-helix domain-containing protein [Cohnella fermenti]